MTATCTTRTNLDVQLAAPVDVVTAEQLVITPPPRWRSLCLIHAPARHFTASGLQLAGMQSAGNTTCNDLTAANTCRLLRHPAGHLGWAGGIIFLSFSFWVSW
jgi:hypothetical protein